MLHVDTIRHQVAVFGQVTNGHTRKPIASAVVRINARNRAFAAETRSNEQGIYWFLDLRAGPYELAAWVPAVGSELGRHSAEVTIAPDQHGNISRTEANIVLLPTCVRGKVVSAGNRLPIATAEMTVIGSGERIFTDESGEFCLAGIEAGNRRVEAHAPGFKSEVKAVTIPTPGSSETLDFTLKRRRAEQ